MKCNSILIIGCLFVLFTECLVVAAPSTATTDDLAAAVERMAEIGAAWSPSFSPDGNELAFVCRLSGIPQLWIVSAEGGTPRQVTQLKDPVNRVVWSPTGEWLAFSVAPGGGMNEQIYLIRPDCTGLQRLTDGGKETNWIGRWNRDGSWFTLASNRSDPQAADAFIYEHGKGLRLVAKNTGLGWLTDVSSDRSRGILWQMVNRSDSNHYLLDLATDQETPEKVAGHGKVLLTPHDPPGSFFNGRFSPDGRTIYLATNKDRDLEAFGRVVLDDRGQPGPIEVLAARDDAELEDFDVSRSGQTAVLAWNVGGRNVFELLDLKSLAITPVPKSPAGVVTDLTLSQDGRRFAFALSSPTKPPDVWWIDTQTLEPRQVTDSPHDGVDLAKLVEPELIKFPAHDGLELSGWLYRPQNFQQSGPIVLSFHGGPEAQERTRFTPLYQALVARGIAVFAPNVRGSYGFGKRFLNLDNRELRFNAIKDIDASARAVIERGIADPQRIGIMGGSYGGYMTMAGLTEFPERFAAGVFYVGVVNWETFFANTEPWMAAVSTIEYGDPVADRDLLRRLSPIHKMDRVTAPTLVLHGANDTNCPFTEPQQVVDNLKQRGIPVEFILFPDEGHGVSKTVNRITLIVAMVNWFERYLTQDAADPSQQ